jgi:hypothetical protein
MSQTDPKQGPVADAVQTAPDRELLVPRGDLPSYLLQKRGFKTTAKSLAVMACRGLGPEYSIVGRTAYYRADKALAWVDAEVQKGTRRVAAE